MKRAKHEGRHPVNCPACITRAQASQMPWECDYILHIGNHEADFVRVHQAALRRRTRAQAMRDCGLVKVKGALGGTYWE